MKRIKHIWKYLTSPTYRYWVDRCTRQELINKNMSLIEDNLRKQSHPMFIMTDVQKLNKPTSARKHENS